MGTNYSEILIKTQTFSFKKMYLKIQTGGHIVCCMTLTSSVVYGANCGTPDRDNIFNQPYYLLRNYTQNIYITVKSSWNDIWNIKDGLVQERRKSIANALELRLSCTNPSIWSLKAGRLSRQEKQEYVRFRFDPGKWGTLCIFFPDLTRLVPLYVFLFWKKKLGDWGDRKQNFTNIYPPFQSSISCFPSIMVIKKFSSQN